MVVRESVDLDSRGSVVQDLPELRREALVRLSVEHELGHRARLMPPRIVVVVRGGMQAQLHVVVRPNPFRGVDHTPLEGGIDISTRSQDRGAAGFDVYLTAQARPDTHLESFEVGDRVRLLSEPPGHLGRHARAGTWHEPEGCVHLFPELESVALM